MEMFLILQGQNQHHVSKILLIFHRLQCRMARLEQNIHILHASSPDYLLAQEDCLSRTIAFEETMQKNHPFTVEYEYDSVVNYVHPLPEEAAGCPSFHTEENLPGIADQ